MFILLMNNIEQGLSYNHPTPSIFMANTVRDQRERVFVLIQSKYIGLQPDSINVDTETHAQYSVPDSNGRHEHIVIDITLPLRSPVFRFPHRSDDGDGARNCDDACGHTCVACGERAYDGEWYKAPRTA